MLTKPIAKSRKNYALEDIPNFCERPRLESSQDMVTARDDNADRP